MTVKELHDLLAKVIKDGAGGSRVLMSDDACGGVIRDINRDLIEVFVQDNGNDYAELEESDIEKGYYENQNYFKGLLLNPKS